MILRTPRTRTIRCALHDRVPQAQGGHYSRRRRSTTAATAGPWTDLAARKLLLLCIERLLHLKHLAPLFQQPRSRGHMVQRQRLQERRVRRSRRGRHDGRNGSCRDYGRMMRKSIFELITGCTAAPGDQAQHFILKAGFALRTHMQDERDLQHSSHCPNEPSGFDVPVYKEPWQRFLFVAPKPAREFFFCPECLPAPYG